MEESHGYVGVETTYDADGEPTGGLMQASGCSGYDGQNNLAQVSLSCSSILYQLQPSLSAHTHVISSTQKDHAR